VQPRCTCQRSEAPWHDELLQIETFGFEGGFSWLPYSWATEEADEPSAVPSYEFGTFRRPAQLGRTRTASPIWRCTPTMSSASTGAPERRTS